MKRVLKIIGWLFFAGGIAFSTQPLLFYIQHRPPVYLQPVAGRAAQPEIGTRWDTWRSSAAKMLSKFGLPPQSSDPISFVTDSSNWWEPAVFRAGVTFKTNLSRDETLKYFAVTARRMGWATERPDEVKLFDDEKSVSYSLEIQPACSVDVCEVRLIMTTNER